LLYEKQNERKDNKIDKKIDYSHGGLQTFKRNEENINEEIAEYNEDNDNADFDDEFINKKRARIVIEPKKQKIYGAVKIDNKKSSNFNFDYTNNDFDYDSTFIPGMGSLDEDNLEVKKSIKDSVKKNIYDYN
jgi:hypothetical protein